MLRHSIVLVALLAFPACTAIDAATTPISAAAPAAVNAAKKALTAAHELHKGAAVFLQIAAESNLCHAQCASDAHKYLDQSEAVLVTADTAIKLGDAPGVEAKIAAATQLISQAEALVGKK